MSSVNFGTWVSPNSMLNQTITYQSTNTVLTNAYKVKTKKTGEALDNQLYQRNRRRLTKLYDTPSWPEENESIRSSALLTVDSVMPLAFSVKMSHTMSLIDDYCMDNVDL
ncbi:hypothetical protein P8452_07250 [Trifolium repens]|nr:hypothetical protein P8452_07250 [Trifolium repens]